MFRCNSLEGMLVIVEILVVVVIESGVDFMIVTYLVDDILFPKRKWIHILFVRRHCDNYFSD